MADLGILGVGIFTDGTRTFIVGTEPVLQVIASADDAKYVYTNDNTGGISTALFQLNALPGDFGNMDTLSIRLRYHWAAGTQTNTWNTLKARVFKADGVTPLTNEITVASTITNTTPTNSSVIAFTGVDTAASPADWDGAVLWINWDITKVKGGDTIQKRVTAAELTGAYTAGVPEGTLVQTLEPVVVAATGSLTLSGALAATLAPVMLDGIGELSPHPDSWEAATDTWDSITVAWDGTGGSVEGTLDVTLSAVTLASAGSLTLEGSLSQTLDDVTLASTGEVALTGVLTQSVGPVVVSAAGTLTIQGELGVTLQPVGLTATGEQGAAPIVGELSQTLEPVVLASTGELELSGILSQTLGPVVLASAATLTLTGSLSQVLDTITLSAVGESEIRIEGVLSQPVGEVALSATGSLAIQGQAANALGEIELASTSVLALRGVLARTLEPVVLEASGFESSPIVGSLSATLAPIMLVAAGEMTQPVVYRGFVPDPFEFKRPKNNPFIRPWRTGW